MNFSRLLDIFVGNETASHLSLLIRPKNCVNLSKIFLLLKINWHILYLVHGRINNLKISLSAQEVFQNFTAEIMPLQEA